MEVAKKYTDENIAIAKRDELSYAIDIVKLAKSFRRHTLGKGDYSTVKSSLLSLFFKKKSSAIRYTHAIKDLTLRIPAGASVGIIGRNGSGKSTLLKLITGIYKPSAGHVSVNGRVAALIELGAGFHPDFTGRENLYLGGVMHGLSRAELDDKFDEIVKFAELEHVIDDPVRTYSSGMFMRLGFSLAVHTDPDVLLIDEVLAVGDAAFVSKCKERIALLRKEGKTLLLVTHDLEAVERWCDEALWLDKGAVQDRGDPRRVIDAYRQFVEKGEEQELMEEQQKEEEPAEEHQEANALEDTQPQRWGSREVEIENVRLLNNDKNEQLLFRPEDVLRVEIAYKVNEANDDIVFGIGINRSDGVAIHGTNTDIEKEQMPALGTKGKVTYVIERLGLLEGNYSLDIAVHKKDGYPYDYHKGVLNFAVRWPLKQIGVVLPQHRWEVELSPGVE